MHISKDQFDNIRHLLQDRLGNQLHVETLPHYRYDEKTHNGVINGTIYVYTFEQQGKKFKIEVIEKEKVVEHEKMKDGRVVGRHFETIPDQYTYSMNLFLDRDGEWTKMDLDVNHFPL
jgi:hypothetical protein